MLEQLRNNRRLAHGVLAGFVLLWLVALLCGMPVRTALPQPSICSAAAPGHAAMGGEADAMPAEQPAHHGPQCVLCLALGAPPAVPLHGYRPPVPGVHRAWREQAVPVVQFLAAAALPARGPPVQRT